MDMREAHKTIAALFPKARMVQCKSDFEYPYHKYDPKAPDVVQVDEISACHIIRVYADKGGMAIWQVNSRTKAGFEACVNMIQKRFPPTAILTYVGTYENDKEKQDRVLKFLNDSYDEAANEKLP